SVPGGPRLEKLGRSPGDHRYSTGRVRAGPRGTMAAPVEASPMSALCVVVLNRKGGVGKTSTCFHLSGTLARMGHRVLLIDCDPQANLSEGLLGAQVEGFPPDRTIAALYGDAFLPDPRALIVPTPIDGVDLLPGSEAMEDYSEPRPAGHRSQGVLREFVD